MFTENGYWKKIQKHIMDNGGTFLDSIKVPRQVCEYVTIFPPLKHNTSSNSKYSSKPSTCKRQICM